MSPHPTLPNAGAPGIAFDGIVKAFGPVEVLHGISFDLPPGRVVGLLGENGAGKSTLMKILAGYEDPTAGSVRIDGVVRRFDGPRAAEAHGIVMIHQEFALADDLTIAQNVFLGHELRRGLWLDDTAMRVQTSRVLAQVGLTRSPDTPVRQLIVAEKQLVEIAKALQRDARVLVMDEPTATLTPSETERLFGLIAQLPDDTSWREVERHAVQHLHRTERLHDAVEGHRHRTGAHATTTLPRPRSISCSASTPAPISPAWSPSGV